MADTVKKSRIVSDDEENLEEALLEEFNLRLKNCMSKDDIQAVETEPEQTDTVYENVSDSEERIPKSGIASNDFLQNERHHYDLPPDLENPSAHPQIHAENIYETLPERPTQKTDHADQRHVEISQHEPLHPNLTLCLSPETQPDKPTFSLETTDFSELRSPEGPGQSVKDRMFLGTDAAATLLFTQTVTSPMLTPSDENIDFLKGFRSPGSDESADVDKTSASEAPVHDDEAIYENWKGVRPAEENVYENLRDVKKAVEELEEHIYQDIDECAKEDGVYEMVEDVEEAGRVELMVDNGLYVEVEEGESEGGAVEHEDVEEETHYESIGVDHEGTTEGQEEESHFGRIGVDHEGTTEGQEEESHFGRIGVDHEGTTEGQEEESHFGRIGVDHEGTTEGQEEESHFERIGVDHEGTTMYHKEESRSEGECHIDTNHESLGTRETYTEFIHHSKTESNYYEKYTEVLTRSPDVANKEKDTESVPAEIVKNLKSQFSKGGGAEVVAITKKDVGDVDDLRDIDITKQINRFENSDSGDSNDSTVTESYSETTTIQSDVPEEKSLKKKKIKKSRKEEKENISVNEFDVVVNEEEYVYNVNVKNLRTKSLTNVLLSPNNNIENVFSEVSVRSLKSSFSKFDALQKKNVLHIRSSDSTKAQDKFNGSQTVDSSNCKACAKQVFQMEQMKAEKAVWHKNCFRCTECSKQLRSQKEGQTSSKELNQPSLASWSKVDSAVSILDGAVKCESVSERLVLVETYVSHDGNLYCKPHFKSLFAPKVVEEESPPRPRKPELIIRENQPLELPPDVVRGTGASDKPDLGLENLQSLNVKERFQVFEQFQTEAHESDREPAPINVKRSSSILSKLARFQAKGMDVGVSDDALNGIPIEESSSEEEEEEVPEGEDPTLYRAKRVQKEKPFHFTNLSEVKNKWEQGERNSRDERREEKKQEIQSIRNKLFLGKQGRMKEAYQQAIIQSESCTNLVKSEKIESCDTKSLKERFEKGQLSTEKEVKSGDEDTEVFQSEISKKSRSLFLELDANASKPPQISPVKPQKTEVQKAREAYLTKSASQDTVKSSEVVEDVIEVKTADIQQRFKFFETYKEPEKEKKRFRITPPRDPSQVKTDTPEREIYHDPEVVRSDENVDDSVIAKTSHTASKMLNKFRQMEENLFREPEPVGPKPLKRFTPPPEPARPESDSDEESETEEEESEEGEDQMDNQRLPEDLVEAQKAARAKQLRAKFEKWEAQEIKKEQTQTVNIVEEYGDESQVESTKSLRARFESMKETGSDTSKTPRVKVNRFVEIPSITEACEGCDGKVYPLEKISVHGQIYHKNCFKCKECSCVLRMDTYSYNQGLLYCIPHFKRLFITKGNYDTAFGLDQHKEKWNINATMA